MRPKAAKDLGEDVNYRSHDRELLYLFGGGQSVIEDKRLHPI